MECTQRLECTQDLYETHTEKICPEQIGFLGICGTKHPVKRGPNKIGRDPQTCSIVLNLNSISRQHAVINVLNGAEFMLMDLESANKTKLLGKTLEPFIPHPLSNGDTVQFGDVFGIFRLLEEETDLPMTQAIDIPETPVFNRHASRVNKTAITTVPESPDVSDRDESFIIPSQPKGDRFKSPSSKYIKPSAKSVSIQPIGSNKIDNVYWKSSKKSTSLNLHLDESNNSLNSSVTSGSSNKTLVNHNDDIHEMETQAPYLNDSTDSIYTAETQIPVQSNESPSINCLDTQLPVPEHLPGVCKINEQHEMQFDLCAANKENDISIFNAETQFPVELNRLALKSENDDNIHDADTQIVAVEKQTANNEKPYDKESIFEAQTQPIYETRSTVDKTEIESKNDAPTNKHNISDEEILFDEIDSQSFLEDFNSQPLLPPVTEPEEDAETIQLSQTVKEDFEQIDPKPVKRNTRLKSDSSTDCDDFDMLPTQKISAKPVDEDLTDCEDDLIEINPEPKECNVFTDNSKMKFEDMATQVIVTDVIDKQTNFEDFPTQVIPEDITENGMDFEDLPTQVLDDLPKANIAVDNLSRLNCKEMISPFKIPMQTPLKNKRKEMSNDTVHVQPKAFVPTKPTSDENDDKYYAATQDIFEDLCSQAHVSSDIGKANVAKSINNNLLLNKEGKTDVDDKLRLVSADKSSESSEGEEKVTQFVANLSTSQIRDVIGVEEQIAKPRRMPSDPSDVEVTPKKVRPFRFIETDLPDSQEIKTSVSISARSLVTESSSESEVENESQEMTPILFKKRKNKPKIDAKIDLIDKFNAEALPSRVITRLRKPTFKVQNSDEGTKKRSINILRPKFLTEQDDDVDKDIITENISRLKNKIEKKSIKDTNCVKTKNYKNYKDSKTRQNNNVQQTDKPNDSKNVQPEIKVAREANESQTTIKKYFNQRGTQSKETETLESDNSKSKLKERCRYNKSKQKDTKSKNETGTRKSRTSDTNNSKENNEGLNSIVDTNSSTRRTRRSRNTPKDNSKSEKNKSPSPEKDVPKRKRGRPKLQKDANHDTDNRSETRRSKRQNSSKTEVKPAPKHEQSTVYNISSDTSVDSVKSLKRAAVDNDHVPSSKRVRSIVNSSGILLRATPARTARVHHVLFTAFPSDEVRVKLEKLGAIIVTDVKACTVVLTLQIKRTFKLLCAVGLGKPIVGPAWVQACVDNNTIADPWLYLIKDEASEKRFHFSLARTLASKREFLKGYNVSATPKVTPSALEMKLIVECSGGTWHASGPRWICVSCLEDRALWPALKEQGATLVHSEFILSGVLRQTLDIQGTRLEK